MLRALAAVALLSLTLAPTRADDATVPAGQFADLTAPVKAGQKVIWYITPTPVQRAPNLPNGRLIFTGRKGVEYSVKALVIDFKSQDVAEHEYTRTFGAEKLDPAPDPRPKPDPKPEPDPKPAGPFWVIVVEETSQRGTLPSDVWSLLSDTKLWGDIRGKGHKYRSYDKDSSDAVRLGYTSKAQAVGLPAVLLLDADGDVVRSFRANRADLEALAK